MAALLMVGYMVWIRLAMTNYALFFGLIEFPSFAETVTLLVTPKGIGMLSVGTFLGALFVIIAISIMAFSLPAFLKEDLDAITAIVRSAAVVRYNPMVAFKWAIIVSIGMMVGFAMGFLGFIIVFSILGYATWHAYSDTLAKQTVSQPFRLLECVSRRPRPVRGHPDQARHAIDLCAEFSVRHSSPVSC
jgi:uncharacterized membrane protein